MVTLQKRMKGDSIHTSWNVCAHKMDVIQISDYMRSLHLWLIHWRQFTESWNTWIAPRPNQRPSDPPTWIFCFYFYENLTSERKMLRVGLTKSVFVSLTFEENVMSITVSTPLSSCKSFVCVWIVLQGKGQSDTRLPSAKSKMASKD